MPKGTGAYKLAANYAPGVVAQKSAAKQGYAQNLWLHGPEHWLTEVGTMNLFAVIKDKDGSKHSPQAVSRLHVEFIVFAVTNSLLPLSME